MAILISSRNEYIDDVRHINFQWNLLIRSRYSDVNCASPSVSWVHVPHVRATTEGFKTTHIELVWWGDLKTSYGHTEIYILAMATMNICTTIHNKRKVTNRDLNRAQCYFWCQCGKPNLIRWWVIASTFAVNLDLKVYSDLQGQYQSLPKQPPKIGTLTTEFCISGPNVVILAWRTHTYRETDAGDDHTWRPKPLSGKMLIWIVFPLTHKILSKLSRINATLTLFATQIMAWRFLCIFISKE